MRKYYIYIFVNIIYSNKEKINVIAEEFSQLGTTQQEFYLKHTPSSCILLPDNHIISIFIMPKININLEQDSICSYGMAIFSPERKLQYSGVFLSSLNENNFINKDIVNSIIFSPQGEFYSLVKYNEENYYEKFFDRKNKKTLNKKKIDSSEYSNFILELRDLYENYLNNGKKTPVPSRLLDDSYNILGEYKIYIFYRNIPHLSLQNNEENCNKNNILLVLVLNPDNTIQNMYSSGSCCY